MMTTAFRARSRRRCSSWRSRSLLFNIATGLLYQTLRRGSAADGPVRDRAGRRGHDCAPWPTADRVSPRPRIRTNAVTGERRTARRQSARTARAILRSSSYYAFHMERARVRHLGNLRRGFARRRRRTHAGAAQSAASKSRPAILLSSASESCSPRRASPSFAPRSSARGRAGFATDRYVVAFGLASPLVLYRGPSNPFAWGSRSSRRCWPRSTARSSSWRVMPSCRFRTSAIRQHRQRLVANLHRHRS